MSVRRAAKAIVAYSVTKLKPVYFSYRKVWDDNEFAHLVLSRNPVFVKKHQRMSPYQKLRFWTRKYLWRARNAAFVRKMRAEENDRKPSRES